MRDSGMWMGIALLPVGPECQCPSVSTSRALVENAYNSQFASHSI